MELILTTQLVEQGVESLAQAVSGTKHQLYEFCHQKHGTTGLATSTSLLIQVLGPKLYKSEKTANLKIKNLEDFLTRESSLWPLGAEMTQDHVKVQKLLLKQSHSSRVGVSCEVWSRDLTSIQHILGCNHWPSKCQMLG